MGQAAPQPARAGSAAPAHTATVAHTAQPTPSFWEKTLEPSIFWNAASAIATLLAVIVALLTPFLLDFVQHKRRRGHAVAVAHAILHDAVRTERVARDTLSLISGMIKGLDNPGHRALGTYAYNQRSASIPSGLTYDSTGVRYCVSDQGKEMLERLGSLKLKNFRDNQTYMADLPARDVALIHSKFAEAERLLVEWERFCAALPPVDKILSKHLMAASNLASALITNLRIGTRVLAGVTGQSWPKEWDQALLPPARSDAA